MKEKFLFSAWSVDTELIALSPTTRREGHHLPAVKCQSTGLNDSGPREREASSSESPT